MEIVKHQIEFQKFNHFSELTPMQITLLDRALAEASKAYAPYSKYHVGVALLLSNQEIITGNNQENAAYPSGLCAERIAAFYAKAQFPKAKILKMAITIQTPDHQSAVPFPCGSCRQVLSEYERVDNQSIELIIKGNDSSVFVFPSVSSILPFSFNLNL